MPRGNGKKNHSTNKERSYVAMKKASRWKHSKREQSLHQRKVLDQDKAFWNGDGDYPNRTGRR